MTSSQRAPVLRLPGDAALQGVCADAQAEVGGHRAHGVWDDRRGVHHHPDCPGAFSRHLSSILTS